VCPLEVFRYKSIGYRGATGLVYKADREGVGVGRTKC